MNSRIGLSLVGGLLLVALVLFAPVSGAQTGTFVDKLNASHVRVVTYNIGGFINGFSDSGFQQVNDNGSLVWEFIPTNSRVVDALDADVWAFQEINGRSASDIQSAMNRADPLPGGASWNVFRFSNQVLASRHPFADTDATLFGSPRSPTVATVDIPSAQGSTDFRFFNVHLKAGGGSTNESRRIEDIDRIIEHLREVQIPGGRDDLPTNQPFVVLGDFNTASGSGPVNNLRLGDIDDEATYGPDSLLDWNSSALTQVASRHNGRESATWTFNNNGFTSRLDYQIYSDSVTTLEQSFILNTRTMTSAERGATGLQFDDVLFDASSNRWDHLPMVVDYSTSFVVIPEPATLMLVVMVGVLVRPVRGRGREA